VPPASTSRPNLRAIAAFASVVALALGACSSSSATARTSAAPIRATPAPSTGSAGPSGAPDCSLTPDTADLGRLARQGPSNGVWVGMNLDWGSETVADVTGRLGRPSADVVSFVGFPLSAEDAKNLDAAAKQAREARALLVVTLQPPRNHPRLGVHVFHPDPRR
jgi:hypothetical protein